MWDRKVCGLELKGVGYDGNRGLGQKVRVWGQRRVCLRQKGTGLGQGYGFGTRFWDRDVGMEERFGFGTEVWMLGKAWVWNNGVGLEHRSVDFFQRDVGLGQRGVHFKESVRFKEMLVWNREMWVGKMVWVWDRKVEV